MATDTPRPLYGKKTPKKTSGVNRLMWVSELYTGHEEVMPA